MPRSGCFLGVTYTRQKQYKEARENLKKSVQINFAYASPNYLLAEVFHTSKYKVPAMLAAARHLTLEINTPRAGRSVSIFLNALQSAKKNEKTGNINIFVDGDAPKDEGDFLMYDLMLGTLTTVKAEKDAKKSESEIFAEAVDTLIALLSEDKKLASTFVGKTYIPFLVEMKKRGFTKTFAYLVLQQSGSKEAEKSLIDNADQTLAFMNWAKSHQLTKYSKRPVEMRFASRFYKSFYSRISIVPVPSSVKTSLNSALRSVPEIT